MKINEIKIPGKSDLNADAIMKHLSNTDNVDDATFKDYTDSMVKKKQITQQEQDTMKRNRLEYKKKAQQEQSKKAELSSAAVAGSEKAKKHESQPLNKAGISDASRWAPSKQQLTNKPQTSQSKEDKYKNQLYATLKKNEDIELIASMITENPDVERQMSEGWRPEPGEKWDDDVPRSISKYEKHIAPNKYNNLRKKVIQSLEEAGISDYELFGAGKAGERLSALEYSGSLRVIGPNDPKAAEVFIRIIQDVAAKEGFKVDMDRPPSVSHAFGQTIRRKGGKESESVSRRPVLYVYQSYSTDMPSMHEIGRAEEAGADPEDVKRMYRSLKFYEDIPRFAAEIPEKPGDVIVPLHFIIAEQLSKTPEFEILKEELNEACKTVTNISRRIHVPISINENKSMIYLVAETQNGNKYIDIACPVEVKDAILIEISKRL